MLFHTFSSQEKRRKFNGSDFIEIQFCRLPKGTAVEKIVSVDSIRDGLNDSLYVSGNDGNTFWEEYNDVFDCGIYNNLETGKIDLYGINYYEPGLINCIISKLIKIKPMDYEKLV